MLTEIIVWATALIMVAMTSLAALVAMEMKKDWAWLVWITFAVITISAARYI